MARLTYPGVYVEEIPSGVRTITGVATSITAFIGRARRGPVNEAITIQSYADYERVYGGLWESSALGFAVRDFYLNGGSQAVIVRLFHPFYEDQATQDEAVAAAQVVIDAVNAVAEPTLNDGLSAAQSEHASQVSADAAVAPVADAVIAALQLAGAEVDATRESVEAAGEAAIDTSATPAQQAAGEAIIGAFADVIQGGADDAATAAQDAVDNLSNPQAHETEAAEAVRDAASAAAAEPFTDAAFVKATVAAALAGAAPVNRSTIELNDNVNTLRLEAANPGSWGNQLRARVTHDALDPDGSDSTTRFNLTVKDEATDVIEAFANLSLDPNDSRFVTDILHDRSSLVRTLGALPALRPVANDPVPPGADPFADATSTGVTLFASDGAALDANDYLGSLNDKEGFYALEDVDLFNLLCLPMLEADAASTYPAVLNTALAYCEQKRAFFVMDPLPDWTDKASARDGMTAFSPKSRNAAVFFPRLLQRNPLRDFQVQSFPPCGAIAGIMARTDGARGVWKAPAGQEAVIKGITGLSVKMTDAENGELNPLGVNCLRTFPGIGSIVWGARTLQGDDRLASEWKYVPVVRTLLFLQESLYRGTHWVVFEPNDVSLWAQIRLNVGAFMHGLFQKGAFQGSTPKEAYFVKCDSETTTQNDINSGVVNVHVGFAPLRPAEFVVLKFQQIMQSES